MKNIPLNVALEDQSICSLYWNVTEQYTYICWVARNGNGRHHRSLCTPTNSDIRSNFTWKSLFACKHDREHLHGHRCIETSATWSILHPEPIIFVPDWKPTKGREHWSCRPLWTHSHVIDRHTFVREVLGKEETSKEHRQGKNVHLSPGRAPAQTFHCIFLNLYKLCCHSNLQLEGFGDKMSEIQKASWSDVCGFFQKISSLRTEICT